MKSIIRALSGVLLMTAILATSQAQGDELRNVKLGETLPAYELPTLGGEKTSSADLAGKVVVLVFLSAQQRSSEAATTDAHEVFRSLRHDDLTLLFVTADTAQTAYFRQQRDKTNVHEPLGLDFERKLYGDLGLIVLPTTVIIDREGRLARVISGYKSDYGHVLMAYTRHTLGLIDDEKLQQELKAESFRRDRPSDRIARHRAAAELLRKNGLYGDAENELKAALAIDADHVDARLDLASLYIVDDRVGEAKAIVDDVLAKNAYHRRGKLLHGIVLYHSDDLDGAETVLSEALMLNPDPVHTHYYLGLIYEKKGEMAKAAEHYRQSLQRLLKDRPV